MINIMNRKEREVQYALGLVSWYRIETRDFFGGYLEGYRASFKDVSEEGALQQFKDYIRYKSPKIIKNVNDGRYRIWILPWTVHYYHY